MLMKKLQLSALSLLLATGPALAEPFDLNALIAAAKSEPPITIYDSTGKIVDMAEAFSAKYGLKATGQKVSANSQLEMLIREAQAGNIQGDVALLTDTPAAIAQLLPTNVLHSWVPADLEPDIPESYRSPLAISTNANVWAYNTEKYPECPVTNIWQLTEPEWRGKVVLIDPLTKGTYTDWFNQMALHGEDALKAAYQAQYGKPLASDQPSAAAAWLAAMGANAPLMADGDDRVSEAVGAPGQPEPFMGLLSSAKFRDNADKGYRLGLCTGMNPWVGWSYSKLGLIASGTDSPNAAKLFIHYVLTEEGIMPQMMDGKMPTSAKIALPQDEPSGLAQHLADLFPYDAKTGMEDWDSRQDWQDFWRVHHTR
ncbi:extracellular solute-binding protein [Paracoccus litorisediminis]|uniref:Extracellular solute-binding protein n=2 Tax=Paracoccus litorisediminis TaxID=2006130 RepID=A0A844HVR7_9RHOB|nr:extracellular solute-binding protein [Paracoccus litorisediminis]